MKCCIEKKKRIKSIYEDKDIWRLLHTYQRRLLAASRSQHVFLQSWRGAGREGASVGREGTSVSTGDGVAREGPRVSPTITPLCCHLAAPQLLAALGHGVR